MDLQPSTSRCPMIRKAVIVFPELYLVSREYGGPEEGGWWWDRYVLEKTFQARIIECSCDREFLQRTMDRLARFLNKVEGRRNLSSVLSDGVYQGATCETPGQWATKVIPTWQ